MMFSKAKREDEVHRENLELHYEVKLMKEKFALQEEKWTQCWNNLNATKDQVIRNWEERGTKYAAHNDKLQDALFKIHSSIAEIVNNPARLVDLKSFLNKALDNLAKETK